jgi:flagellar hook protein FlgE
MTSAISGLKAHQNAMDIVGNNIANVNTNGFKSSGASFRDSLYQTLSDGGGDDAANGLAGSNPAQIGYGASLSGVNMDMTKGGQSATGRAMDCYINGGGYFVISNKGTVSSGNYSGTVQYSRLGELKFDDAGYLTDGNGNYVLSATTASGSTTYSTIKQDNTKTITNTAIGEDGTVSWKETDSSTPPVTASKTAKIAIATFPNDTGLKQLGNGYYGETSNSGAAKYTTPGVGEAGKLVTGVLEASNVDLATEFSNMIIYERGYQANTKIITAEDEMLQTLVNMK